jgi:glycosyltransferase involved in cell wall biosynthesis
MKNVLIIYPNGFPNSVAATNRIISLSLALITGGNRVKIIINRPTERQESQLNFDKKGIFNNIHYEYSTNNLIWPQNKLLKIVLHYYGLVLSVAKLVNENRSLRIDVLISAATTSFFDNFVYFSYTKIFKIPLVHTLDEYPWVLINQGRYFSFYRNIYIKYFYLLFNGFIVMTKVLIDYYKKLSKKDSIFFHFPMTVEFERFKNKSQDYVDDYIAYCGADKSGRKDGIDVLVKAFKIVKSKLPKLKLYIIGIVHPDIKELVKSLNISEDVIFTGLVTRDDIPILLSNAKALCLARPNNLQAEGGFPTKLGEYLATGRPVVVTDVGEITDYLTDGRDVFIAKPNDANNFAEKLLYVFENYEEALLIGTEGQKTCRKHFEYSNYINPLNEYLEKIVAIKL